MLWQCSSAPLDPYLIHDPLGPSEPTTQRHLDRFSHFLFIYFAGLTTVTDRQTDRQTTLLGQ